ncbi:MAG TPA: DnaJ domain-containing protein [Kofleriaceae bacterium]
MGKEPVENYYELFGVDDDADLATLRQAWRQLALRWHPDRAGPDTTVIFQKLSKAYAVLSDPHKRAAYDRQRGTKPRPKPAPPAPPAPPPRRRAPGVLLTRISRSLDILLAMGVARRVEPDVFELLLDAEEATEGGMVTISMRVPVHGPTGITEELFSAWLAIPPEVADGTVLAPSVLLPGMQPVSFRVRVPS